MTDLVEQMKMDLALLSYSPKTIQSYSHHVGLFLKALHKPAESATEEDIRGYLYTMKTVKKASQSNLSQAFSAIKFLYRSTLDMPLKLSEVKSVRRGRKLPVVLSGEEIKRLFHSADNIKHRTILMTIYGGGLRLSETTHLKVSDIDGERMQIRVEQGKGKKDRYTILSSVLLEQLRCYWRHEHPGMWLFPNRSQDRPISEGTVQKVFHRAKKKPAS
jgi:integrase/recombinase XerD